MSSVFVWVCSLDYCPAKVRDVPPGQGRVCPSARHLLKYLQGYMCKCTYEWMK